MSTADNGVASANASSSPQVKDAKSAVVDTYALGEGLEAQPSVRSATHSVSATESRNDDVNNNDLGESDGSTYAPQEKLRHKIARVRFVWWFVLGAAIFAVPLVLSATTFNAVRIGNVRLLGFLFWLELSWAGVWCSYFVAWCLGRIFYEMCQEDKFDCDDYEHLIDALRTPLTLLFWSIILWALTPILCSFNHEPCTSAWVSVFKKVLLATLVVAAIFFAKSVLVELLYAESTTGFLSFRKKVLEKRASALFILMVDPGTRNPNAGSMNWLQQKAYSLRFGAVSKLHEMAKFCFSPDVFRHPPRDVQADFSQNFFINGSSTQQDYETIRDSIFVSFLQSSKDEEGSPATLTETQVARRFRRHQNNPLAPAVLSRIQSLKDLMKILDPNGDDKVDGDELVWLAREFGQGLVEVNKGRGDIREVLNNLDRVLSLLVLIGIGLVYAAFFSKHLGNYLTPLWTTFTGVSFALAGSVQEFIASCAFVFAKHPYDVGDRVTLKERELIVERILLTHTVFRRADNGKVTHIPHSEVSTECIENLSRTSRLVETSMLQVPPEITASSISEIERKLVKLMNASKDPPISRYLKTTLRLAMGTVTGAEPWLTAEETATRRGLEVSIKYEEGTGFTSASILEKCREATMNMLQKLLDEKYSCSRAGLSTAASSVEEDHTQTEASVPATGSPVQVPVTRGQDAISSAVETSEGLTRRLI